MQNRINHRMSFIFVAAFAALTAAADAQVIYSDNFDTGSRTTIAGRSPQTDLPSQTWAVSRDYTTSSGEFYAWTNTPGFTTGPNQATSLFLWNGNSGTTGNGAATLSLASGGSYTKPSQLQLSADLQCTALATGAQGFLLGFYSAAPTNLVDSLTGFSGFMVNQTGALMLVQNGVVGSAVAFTGTFDNTLFNTLSYTVNTATGAISNVSFGGNTSYSFSSTVFTSSNTAYTGIGMESTGSNTFGYADNFTVTGLTSAPEPSTWLLLVSGLGAFLAYRSRVGLRL